MSKEKNLYTRSELEEFEAIINKKMKEVNDEIDRLQTRIDESNENQSDSNINDYGSESADKEQTEMFLVRQKKFKEQLDHAMVRIKNGTYGRCKVTGKLIPKERLRIVPHTESSMEAKSQQR